MDTWRAMDESLSPTTTPTPLFAMICGTYLPRIAMGKVKRKKNASVLYPLHQPGGAMVRGFAATFVRFPGKFMSWLLTALNYKEDGVSILFGGVLGWGRG